MSRISVENHFKGKDPQLKAAYDRLIAALHEFGEVNEVAKKTSILLEKKMEFAGVHPGKGFFNLEFRTIHPLESPRIIKSEQLSERRFEHRIKIVQPDDIDDQLLKWLKDAYETSK